MGFPALWILSYFQIHISTYMVFIFILSEPHLKHQDNDLVKVFSHDAFVRRDLDNWNIVHLAPIYCTFYIRLAIIAALLVSGVPIVFSLMIWKGVTRASQLDYLKSLSYRVNRAVIQFICRAVAFVSGIGLIKVEYVSSGEGDYSKWLGEDWEPEWTGASTLISNHVSWLDYFVALSIFKISFFAKKPSENKVLEGTFCQSIDCLFLDPKIAFKQISER
mmetsp:Transcript_16442/g.27893  ORF Transcript_16442/g.27893 Transcript_16442/m.27893 type:complete len:219 (-) Transcript_16442:634-1290(-)